MISAPMAVPTGAMSVITAPMAVIIAPMAVIIGAMGVISAPMAVPAGAMIAITAPMAVIIGAIGVISALIAVIIAPMAAIIAPMAVVIAPMAVLLTASTSIIVASVAILRPMAAILPAIGTVRWPLVLRIAPLVAMTASLRRCRRGAVTVLAGRRRLLCSRVAVPIPFAPLLGFVLGTALAFAAGLELSRTDGPLVASRPFAVLIAFAALVYTPVCGYFVAFHGDWAYVYEVAWRSVPSALDFALVLLGGLSVVLGFFAAVPLVRRRKTGAVAVLAVLPAGIGLALLALTARRLAWSATYAQFHGEFGAEPLADSTLGRGVLLMGIVLALGIAWCVRAMWAMGSEPRR